MFPDVWIFETASWVTDFIQGLHYMACKSRLISSCIVATFRFPFRSETCTKTPSRVSVLQSASSASLQLCIAVWFFLPMGKVLAKMPTWLWMNQVCLSQSLLCASMLFQCKSLGPFFFNYYDYYYSRFLCANMRVCPIKLLSGLCRYYLKDRLRKRVGEEIVSVWTLLALSRTACVPLRPSSKSTLTCHRPRLWRMEAQTRA